MITIPSTLPQVLRSVETDFGTSIAKDIWLRAIRILNWFNAQMPVGIIMHFYDSQTYASGVPIPDPSGAWKYCDGSAISDLESPLVGQNTPDMRSRYLKGGGTPGITGGSSFLNLVHDHTGLTGTFNNRGGRAIVEEGSNEVQGNTHRHGITNPPGLLGIDLVPPFHDLQTYMKINGQVALGGTTGFSRIDDDATYFGQVASRDLATSIRIAINWIRSTIPVGEIAPIMTNIPGVTVNPDIWQECNGSQITQINSPLRSVPGNEHFTPNLSEKYIKIPVNPGSTGLMSGISSYNFAHNHGGYTGYAAMPANAENGHDKQETFDQHRHAILTDLGVSNIEPQFFTVKFFMKIQ